FCRSTGSARADPALIGRALGLAKALRTFAHFGARMQWARTLPLGTGWLGAAGLRSIRDLDLRLVR
ncbi:MAG: hypothetical protein ACYS0F_13355, partial [Planctomycetota bacterium]